MEEGTKMATKYPKLLEEYEVVERIGKGGYAKVFRCSRRKDGAEFACKTTGEHPDDVRMETEMMSRLAGCPGVVRLEEVIHDDHYSHLIMELCGCSLADRIDRSGRFPEPQGALLLRTLASTLLHLHTLGVVHRDLKPSNILLCSSEPPFHVKLSDFGLSACFLPAFDPPCFTDEVGTRRYCAPEILRGAYSTEIDIWGLGLVLYEALTGRFAFSTLTSIEVEDRLRRGQDLRFSHLGFPADLSSSARKLVLAMLHPNPRERISLQQILSHPWILKHSRKKKTFAAQIAKAKRCLLCC